MIERTPYDSWSESYQRGVIDSLQSFNDMMIAANCGCDYAHAIDIIHEIIQEQIEYYEAHFGVWVDTLLAGEIEG